MKYSHFHTLVIINVATQKVAVPVHPHPANLSVTNQGGLETWPLRYLFTFLLCEKHPLRMNQHHRLVLRITHQYQMVVVRWITLLDLALEA